MRCLVLGGVGFIGSHIVDSLLQRGHAVRVFDRPRIDTKNLSNSLSHLELHSGEFFNEDDVAKALVGIDTIVHLISTTTPASSNDNPVYDAETNIAGTVRLLALAKGAGVKKIVFASSGGTVYGDPLQLPIPETHPNNPICSYGITKLTIEKYLHLFHHLHGLDYSILRIANPYGERQNPSGGLGAVTVFLWKMLHGEPITIWGNGEVARDYFYISDLVAAFIKVIEETAPSRIYNIGGGRAYSLNEIIDAIQVVTGKTALVNYTPARKLDVPVNYLDITRARNELAWTPTITLEQGIAKTHAWLEGLQRTC
jgi:UDP-glucose 4-epimerase